MHTNNRSLKPMSIALLHYYGPLVLIGAIAATLSIYVSCANNKRRLYIIAMALPGVVITFTIALLAQLKSTVAHGSLLDILPALATIPWMWILSAIIFWHAYQIRLSKSTSTSSVTYHAVFIFVVNALAAITLHALPSVS
jgi:hypothetical protein